MTREEAIQVLNMVEAHGSLVIQAKEMAIKALEQESVLDKIFYIVHPLSIMSTSELEHKAIMQIAEMLEPLCLPESEE